MVSPLRGPEDVLVSGLAGVPWQDIARDATDVGKGFKAAAELSALIAQGGPTAGTSSSATWATHQSP